VNVDDAIVQFGTEAVIEYRDLPAIRKNETAIPEACLSLSIASKLIAKRQQDARVEASYPRILGQLGANGADITPKFGGQRADIAIYDHDVPAFVIEIKIIDEGRRPAGVIDDWKKIALLQSHLKSKGLPIIPGYIGALVCDTGQPLERAIDELSRALELPSSLVTRGVKTPALLGGWTWMFVCITLA
jgi:hypothetical protein